MSGSTEAVEFIPGNTKGWPKTQKQLDFAIQVVQQGCSPHAAMIKAGYAKSYANVHAHKIAAQLRPFLTFLQEKKNEVAAAHYDVTTDRVLREMAAIGLQNVKDYIRAVKIKGITRLIGKAVNELSDLQALSVQSWKAVEIDTDDGPQIDYQYILHDKTNALINLGRHLGMFSEKLMLDLNMRASQARSMDFSAMPQDELEQVIEVLEGIQEKAAKSRAIEGESQRIN